MPQLDQSIINQINDRVAQIRKKADVKIKQAEEQRDMLAALVQEYQAENDRLYRLIRTVANGLELSQIALQSELRGRTNNVNQERL